MAIVEIILVILSGAKNPRISFEATIHYIIGENTLGTKFCEKIGRMDRLREDLELVALRPGLFKQVGGRSLSGEQKYLAIGKFFACGDGGFDSGHSDRKSVV